MIKSRFLCAIIISFFITACETPEQPTPVENTIIIKSEPEAAPETTPTKSRPALNLSIDDLQVDTLNNDYISKQNSFTDGAPATEKNSDLFNQLNKNQSKRDINLSGKIFTDQNKLDNKAYLESVDGLQINIEGKFD